MDLASSKRLQWNQQVELIFLFLILKYGINFKYKVIVLINTERKRNTADDKNVFDLDINQRHILDSLFLDTHY